MDNTTAQIAYNLNAYYDRNLLMRALPNLNYMRFAQMRDIPNNNTDTIKLRRYLAMALATDPLIEGITPQGQQLQYEVITTQVKQYGAYTVVTEWVDWTVEDSVLTELAKIQGEQAGQTLDALMGAYLAAGTNVLYAGSNVARGTITASDKVTGSLFKNATQILKNQKAQKITEMVEPSQGYGTKSVYPSFIGFAHTDTIRDAKDDPEFIKVKDYANPAAALPNEAGSFDEERLLESTQAVIFAGEGAAGANVYATVIVGANSYGCSRIAGKSMENIRKPFGSGGTTDALNQRGTTGWKASWGGLRLYEAHILRVEHGTSNS